MIPLPAFANLWGWEEGSPRRSGSRPLNASQTSTASTPRERERERENQAHPKSLRENAPAPRLGRFRESLSAIAVPFLSSFLFLTLLHARLCCLVLPPPVVADIRVSQPVGGSCVPRIVPIAAAAPRTSCFTPWKTRKRKTCSGRAAPSPCPRGTKATGSAFFCMRNVRRSGS